MKAKNKNTRNGKYNVTALYDVVNKSTGFVFATVDTRSAARRAKALVKQTSGASPKDIAIMQYTSAVVR